MPAPESLIRDLPETERPRERLLDQGSGALSDAELIAVLLRTGKVGCSALQMARELLSETAGLGGLLGLSAASSVAPLVARDNAAQRRRPLLGLIDRAVANIPDAENGFRLIFSSSEFPGVELRLTWRRPEFSGNVYYCQNFDAEAWLCPALMKYFDAPPAELFVRCEGLKPGSVGS